MSRGKIGVALAGGGPLGAIYEIGALVALDEALRGVSLSDCDVYVGVSSGAFMAAGLANGITPREMYRMFIESDAADDPFEPQLLLRPALLEYGRRLASLPRLLGRAASDYLRAPRTHGFVESFLSLGSAIPTGVFDNAGIGAYLSAILSAPGRTNDFRALTRRLYVVATDLDTSEAVAFGAGDWADVPIARAVQASAALPGLYPPVEIRGRHFVDGALMKTLHASVALREGAGLLFCVNALVPFDAKVASRGERAHVGLLVDRGLPTVLSQSFRSLIHSRMKVGMERYRKEFPGADVLLFEPGRGDAEIFLTNVFSYAGRRHLSEHAYRHTRAELRRRLPELAPVVARHGISIDAEVLANEHRRLARPTSGHRRTRPRSLGRAARELDRVLQDLEQALKAQAGRG